MKKQVDLYYCKANRPMIRPKHYFQFKGENGRHIRIRNGFSFDGEGVSALNRYSHRCSGTAGQKTNSQRDGGAERSTFLLGEERLSHQIGEAPYWRI